MVVVNDRIFQFPALILYSLKMHQQKMFSFNFFFFFKKGTIFGIEETLLSFTH